MNVRDFWADLAGIGVPEDQIRMHLPKPLIESEVHDAEEMRMTNGDLYAQVVTRPGAKTIVKFSLYNVPGDEHTEALWRRTAERLQIQPEAKMSAICSRGLAELREHRGRRLERVLGWLR